jgi:hypothetical protein
MWKKTGKKFLKEAREIPAVDFEQDLSGFDGIGDQFDADEDPYHDAGTENILLSNTSTSSVTKQAEEGRRCSSPQSSPVTTADIFTMSRQEVNKLAPNESGGGGGGDQNDKQYSSTSAYAKNLLLSKKDSAAAKNLLGTPSKSSSNKKDSTPVYNKLSPKKVTPSSKSPSLPMNKDHRTSNSPLVKSPTVSSSSSLNKQQPQSSALSRSTSVSTSSSSFSSSIQDYKTLVTKNPSSSSSSSAHNLMVNVNYQNHSTGAADTTTTTSSRSSFSPREGIGGGVIRRNMAPSISSNSTTSITSPPPPPPLSPNTIIRPDLSNLCSPLNIPRTKPVVKYTPQPRKKTPLSTTKVPCFEIEEGYKNHFEIQFDQAFDHSPTQSTSSSSTSNAVVNYMEVSVIFLKVLEDGRLPNTLCYGLSKICELLSKSMTKANFTTSMSNVSSNNEDNLSRESIKHLQQFHEAKITRAIIAAMIMFGNDGRIQTYGLTAIFYLCHDLSNQKQFSLDGSCHVVMNVMSVFKHDASIQLLCCKVIWILSSENRLVMDTFGSNNCFKVLSDLMMKEQSNASMQEWCCRCIINLTVDHNANASKCGKNQGCLHVIHALKIFVNKREVVFSGIRALLNVTVSDVNNRNDCRNQDAIQVIISCLNLYKEDREIQLCGIVTMDNLIRDVEFNLKTISSSSTTSSITNNSAKKSKSKEVALNKLLHEDACNTIVNAMKNFSLDRNIQLQGCRAIYFLTNGQCKSEVRGCVRAAMRNFPDDEEVLQEASDAIGISVQYAGKISKTTSS